MQSTPSSPRQPAVESGGAGVTSDVAVPLSRVGAAVAALAELDTLTLSEHPDIYDRIHGQLRAALAEVDQ